VPQAADWTRFTDSIGAGLLTLGSATSESSVLLMRQTSTMKAPETQYVSVGEADVAYQVLGEGPFDLLYCIGLGSHVELLWDLPHAADFFRRLASFSRLILFDRRGMGASDPLPAAAGNALPPWEDWADDMRAVLDAVGSNEAAVMGEQEAGAMAVLFAATHPQRVRALALSSASARYLVAPDYPIGFDQATVDRLVEFVRQSWGKRELMESVYGPLADDPEFVRLFTRWHRAAATPRTAAAQYRYILESMDVRDALRSVQAPTLVLSYLRSPYPASHSRFLAESLPNAKLIEFDAFADLNEPGKTEDALAVFFTGESRDLAIERILTTVLFTDIVGSTENTVALGDLRWHQILDQHDSLVREELRQHRGREINTTGDGFVASFDGPGRAIRCAQAITTRALALGVEVRAGVHTGECEVRGKDLGGLAVHIAARVGAIAEPSEILVSRTVKDLVIGSGIEFTDRGEFDLKGVPGAWKLFGVAA
jgi:class 3 adenylate cyclase/pimeloyl-ACP methyl ester carboxylesterase